VGLCRERSVGTKAGQTLDNATMAARGKHMAAMRPAGKKNCHFERASIEHWPEIFNVLHLSSRSAGATHNLSILFHDLNVIIVSWFTSSSTCLTSTLE